MLEGRERNVKERTSGNSRQQRREREEEGKDIDVNKDTKRRREVK